MDDTDRRRLKSRERNCRWRERNPEAARAATRKSVAKWRSEHPDAERGAVRAYHAENRDKILAKKKEYYQRVRKKADQSEAGLLADRNRKARRRSITKTGNVSAAEWAEILAHHDHRCAYCGSGERPLEMDHIVALSKGGKHCATNIAPACKPCNSKKGSR